LRGQNKPFLKKLSYVQPFLGAECNYFLDFQMQWHKGHKEFVEVVGRSEVHNRLVFTYGRRPLFTWRPRSSDFVLREVRLFKMAVFARISLLVLVICPAVRAQGRAGSFVTTLE